jgi:hypothetical protein
VGRPWGGGDKRESEEGRAGEGEVRRGGGRKVACPYTTTGYQNLLDCSGRLQ